MLLENLKPDWSPNTIETIDAMLKKNMVVYEWGVGKSTLWLAQRVNFVISMEHNEEWRFRIWDLARDLSIENIEFNIFPLTDDKYYMHIRTVRPDLIIIDGRNRVRCFKEAIKLGVPVMLDDSERERYKEVYDYDVKFAYTIPDEKGQKATIFYPKEMKCDILSQAVRDLSEVY